MSPMRMGAGSYSLLTSSGGSVCGVQRQSPHVPRTKRGVDDSNRVRGPALAARRATP
jgi:hypothetical protein